MTLLKNHEEPDCMELTADIALKKVSIIMESDMCKVSMQMILRDNEKIVNAPNSLPYHTVKFYAFCPLLEAVAISRVNFVAMNIICAI